MVTIPAVTVPDVELFVLVLVRISSMIFMVPIFNDKSIPIILKVGISLLMALLLIVRELAIGITVGFMAAMLLA